MAPAPGAAVIGLPLLLIVPLLAVPGAKARETFGEAGCRCVDPWAAVEGSLSSSPQYDAENDCVRGTDGFCYPTGYGASECRAWDDGVTPPCAVDPALGGKASYCESYFCYVDRASCDLPGFQDSAIFKGYPGFEDFLYSYETCGFLNSYDDNHILKALSSRTLRVAYAGHYPPFVIIEEDGSVDGVWTRFSQRIFDEYSVDVTYRAVSADSLAAFPLSLYSACVHDIGLGRLDMCIGPTWPLSFRRAMPNVAFTAPLFDDELSVVAKRGRQSDSALDILRAPFRPFSSALWLMIVGAVLVSALLYLVIENEVTFGRKNKGASDGAGSPTEDSDYVDISEEEEEEEEAEWPFHVKLTESLYVACMSFVNSGMGYVPETFAGRLLNFGLGFIFLFLVSSYTANLARFLFSEEARGSTISDLSDAISRGTRVCIYEPLLNELVARFPDVLNLSVPFMDPEDILTGMDDGECGLGVVTRLDWDRLTRVEVPASDGRLVRHCESKVLLDEVLLSMGNAFPVRPDLQSSMSWAADKHSVWYEQEFQAFRDRSPPPFCAAVDVTASSSGLTPSDMAGLFVFLGGAFVVSFVVWLFNTLARAYFRRKLRQEARDFVRTNFQGGMNAHEMKVLEDTWVQVMEERKRMEDELGPKEREGRTHRGGPTRSGPSLAVLAGTGSGHITLSRVLDAPTRGQKDNDVEEGQRPVGARPKLTFKGAANAVMAGNRAALMGAQARAPEGETLTFQDAVAKLREFAKENAKAFKHKQAHMRSAPPLEVAPVMMGLGGKSLKASKTMRANRKSRRHKSRLVESRQASKVATKDNRAEGELE